MTIELTMYGELLNSTILTIFGDEMTYNELEFYANDKDNTTDLKVEWNRNTETQLVRVWFNDIVVMDKKYSIHHSCDMFYHLGELELKAEEEDKKKCYFCKSDDIYEEFEDDYFCKDCFEDMVEECSK